MGIVPFTCHDPLLRHVVLEEEECGKERGAMPKEERRRVGMGGAHEYAAGVNSKPVTKLGLASCVESDAGIPDSEFLVKAPTRETQERQRKQRAD